LTKYSYLQSKEIYETVATADSSMNLKWPQSRPFLWIQV